MYTLNDSIPLNEALYGKPGKCLDNDAWLCKKYRDFNG